MKSQLNIVVALSCEAAPIINALGLRKLSLDSPFSIFSNSSSKKRNNKNSHINLIVSGMGKTSSAAATATIAALSQQNNIASWLNVGIAGHSSMEVGKSLLANKILDRSSGKNFYPALLIDYPCITSKLITVDTPETNYGDKSAYDMEASGFFSTACRFSTLEMVQVLKIVSDNPKSPVGQVNKLRIGEWIGSCGKIIESVVDELLKLSLEFDSIYGLPEIYEKILSRYHFSQTRKLQLKELVRRFQALGIIDQLEDAKIEELNSARLLIDKLRTTLEAAPPPYSTTFADINNG